MPVQVYIEVNGRPEATLHIGRAAGGTEPDDVNDYLVIHGGPSPKHDGAYRGPAYGDWDEQGIPFTHRYGDGLEVCVRKAIEALEAAGKLEA